MVFFVGHGKDASDKIDLSGEWNYRLKGVPVSIPGEGVIELPTTLDEAKKSIYNPEGDNTSQLRREFSFIGEASYSKKIEIPEEWEGKDIFLFIERTKPSTLFIDGEKVGFNSRISSPQVYNLTEKLEPGIHDLEIVINNLDSIPPIVARSSHAVSEATQTNWNGILGDFYLESRNPFHIDKVGITDYVPTSPLLRVDFSQPSPGGVFVRLLIDGREESRVAIQPGEDSVELHLKQDKNRLWSAWNPNLLNIQIQVFDKKGKILDSKDFQTGFRQFSTSDKKFTINGSPLFLRGTVNAAVFPLTGYAPTDKESWDKYFSIIKDYGLNHVRFHSWTPPEAAFQAADECGVYILAELPIWGELDRDLAFHNRFLEEDMKGIMEAYSLHPSFVMFTPGNELWGDIPLMGEYMKEAKDMNPRILSTYGTNVYLGMNGQIGGEDFLVSSKTGDDISTSLRGSDSFADTSKGGHFNSTYPESSFVYSNNALEKVTVPVISHEAGQYQSYPDFTEIEKFTGNLKADNLKTFKTRASEAGTLRKNKAFHEASGKWAAKLYKAELELAHRSPGMGGIELFGLQDYPGQGTAIVGILDPFMDSKGFITPEEFRQSSSDLLLLAKFPKFTFTEGEIVEIPVVVANFTDKPDSIRKFEWTIGNASGIVEVAPGLGLAETEGISFRLPKTDVPKQLTLKLSSPERGTYNSYDFWVYPDKLPEVKDIFVTNNLTEALILLDQGQKVLLTPDSVTVAKASIDPLFVTDFWNYRMYRSICDEMNLPPSPGTLGLSINANHPALKKFPTSNHTDWQWFPIVSNSRPLVYDRLPKEFDPIVEVIDNVERNFRLSLILECNVGKGKLMILSADMDKASEYPEGRWLLQSLKEYMASKDFKPSVTLSPEQLVNLVTKPSNARMIKELKNEIYHPFM